METGTLLLASSCNKGIPTLKQRVNTRREPLLAPLRRCQRLATPRCICHPRAVKRMLVMLALVGPLAVPADARPPLYDPQTLNIGLNCQWQRQCMAMQQRAMNRALKFVRREQPPSWRIQLCNKNASRNRMRVDWVGFQNCIRNAALRPLQPARSRKSIRRISQSSGSRSIGERGH